MYHSYDHEFNHTPKWASCNGKALERLKERPEAPCET